MPAEEAIIKEIIKHDKGKIILEEALIKDNTLVLDYEDGQLFLQVNTANLEWLTGKMFF